MAGKSEFMGSPNPEDEKYYVVEKSFDLPRIVSEWTYVSKVHILNVWEKVKLDKFDSEISSLESTLGAMDKSRSNVNKYGTPEQKNAFEKMYGITKKELESTQAERKAFVNSKPTEYFKGQVCECEQLRGEGSVYSKSEIDSNIKYGIMSKIAPKEFNKAEKELGEIGMKKVARLA